MIVDAVATTLNRAMTVDVDAVVRLVKDMSPNPLTIMVVGATIPNPAMIVVAVVVLA